MIVAPFIFGLLTRIGPPPACWDSIRTAWWTLLLWLTIGLTPFLCVCVARLMLNPLKVRKAFLGLVSAICAFFCALVRVVSSVRGAVLVRARCLPVLGPLVSVSSRRLASIHLLLCRPVRLVVVRMMVHDGLSSRGVDIAELSVSGRVLIVVCILWASVV